MPWRELTPVSERLNLCRLAAEGRFSVAELARDFGVSRKTAHKWISRYKESGDVAVFDRSRRPHQSPVRLDEKVVQRILELKDEYQDWGPRKLHTLLEKEMGSGVCSCSSVERTLRRHGLTQIREPKPLLESVGRFERSQPNELWQIDFTSAFRSGDGRKLWPVPVVDDHSRSCVALVAAETVCGASAIAAFVRAASEYGLPKQILSDHGAEFGTSRSYVSEFRAYVWACGVEHIQGEYAHPQTQGKLERFNRTLKTECIRHHSYTSIDDWNKCFEDYRHLYNEIRPHFSLGNSTPASRYAASDTAYVEPDKNERQPGENLIHRRVDRSGKIWILQHHVRVGSGLAGWMVSASHDGNGYWTVQFRDRRICQIHLAKNAQYKPKP